ncbi:MAG: peptide-N-glycosidase F-related protein [Bacteroidota bacterium]
MWNGNFSLSTIDSTVAPITVDLDPSAGMFRLKTRASGHGLDNPTNCAEFCPKIHSVDVNGTTQFSCVKNRTLN